MEGRERVDAKGEGRGERENISEKRRKANRGDQHCLLQGAIMGLFESGASLARGLAPFIMGLLYDNNQMFPFIISFAVLTVSFVAAFFVNGGAQEKVGKTDNRKRRDRKREERRGEERSV